MRQALLLASFSPSKIGQPRCLTCIRHGGRDKTAQREAAGMGEDVVLLKEAAVGLFTVTGAGKYNMYTFYRRMGGLTDGR